MGLLMLGIQKYTQQNHSLVPKPSAFRFELDIEKLKRHKSPDIDQIPSKLIKAGGSTTRYEVHKLFNPIWNKEELPEEWNELIIVPFDTKGDKTKCSNYRSISLCQIHTKFYSTSCCQGLLHMQRKLLVIVSVDFDATGQLLIICSAFVKYLRKNGNTRKQCFSSL